LDTEKPILRIGEEFYEGHYVDTVGTDIFFAPPNGAAAPAASASQKPSLADCYVGQSRKRLAFKKISVTPKDSEVPHP